MHGQRISDSNFYNVATHRRIAASPHRRERHPRAFQLPILGRFSGNAVCGAAHGALAEIIFLFACIRLPVRRELFLTNTSIPGV
jgi:hypothetical protein